MSRREEVLAKCDGRCAYCGEALGAKWHIDHMEPIVRHFKYTGNGTKQTGKCTFPVRKNHDNEWPACIPCNMNKSSLPMEYWRKQIASRLQALRERSTDYKTALRFGLVDEKPRAVVFWFEVMAWGQKFEQLGSTTYTPAVREGEKL